MHCQECGWKIKEGDLVCGWCGRSLLGFEISPTSKKIYLSPQKKIVTLDIDVKNSGSGTMRDIKCSSKEDWISFKEDIFPIESLAPGGKNKIYMVIDPPVSPSSSQEVSVEFSSSNAGSRELNLILLPYPELNIFLKELERDTLPIQKKEGEIVKEIEGEISLKNETEVELEKIYSECEFIKRIDIISSKYLSSDQEAIRIKIFLDLSSLETKVEHHASFHIQFKGIIGDQIYIFYVKCVIPPKIQILRRNNILTDAYRVICIETIPEKIEDLEIRNDGEYPLIIERIELGEELFVLDTQEQFPWEIKQDEEIPLKLIIRSDQKSAGNYEGVLKIFSNGEPSELTVDFLIDILKICPYEDYIAIDFGTTHSCACYFNSEAMDFEKIPMKELDPKAILPSAIQYLEIINNEAKRTVVGETAKQNSYDPQLQLSTITSIKRKLGSEKHLKIFAAENKGEGIWLPEDIISHIINYIFKKIETHIRNKIDRCIISYPSKFRSSQVEALVRAFEASGIKREKIQKIQEPIAAAVDFIVNNPKNEEYDLMVFDFGGGTVDITLIHVNDQTERDKRTITIFTKAREGDSKYGGDDITEELMSLMAEKTQNNGRGALPLETDPLKFSRDEEIKVVTNKLEMIKNADQTKIELSDVDEVQKPIFLHFHKEGKFESQTVNLNVKRVELNERIQDRIEELIDRMKRILEIIPNTNLKVLLLSGKSSQIPLVKDLMIKSFGQEKIHFPVDLKECVAKGAIKYIKIKTTPGKLKINIEEDECTVTNYGYISQDMHGRSYFQVVIPEGTPLATKEIKLEEEGGLERVAPRRFRLVEGPRTAKLRDLKTIAIYYLEAPKDASDEELKKADFYMQMNNDQNIRLISKIGKRKIDFFAKIEEIN